MSYTGVTLPLLSGGSFASAAAASSDGSVVVGSADNSSALQLAVYWDNSNVIHALPSLFGGFSASASACSSDGTVIVGASVAHAVKWTSGVVSDLGFASSGNASQANGCNSDGSVVVGSGNLAPGGAVYPLVWNGAVVTVLPLLSGTTHGSALCCSSDGTKIFGSCTGAVSSHPQATVWTGPSWVATLLPTSAGGTGSSAAGCSSTGSIAVGSAKDSTNANNAAYWTGTILTVLSDPLAGQDSIAQGCDALGTVIVGLTNAFDPGVFVNGVGSVLTLPAGIASVNTLAISADASTIVGLTINSGSAERAVKWTANASSNVATVADLFFSPTSSFVDFTQVANRRKFIAVNGGAQNLQSDGSGPFAVTPPVFLSLQGTDTPANFGNHGRGGAFIRSGPAPTDGASDPPPVTVSTQSAASTVPFSTVLGDYLTGNVYAFNPDTLTDNGQKRKWVRRWRALPGDTTSSITFSYLSIDMETGLEVPPGTNPQLVLRWSDDSGKTWSGNRIVPVGATGETTFTVKFNRLGSTSRFAASTRIFELSSTDPFKVAIIDAEVLTK